MSPKNEPHSCIKHSCGNTKLYKKHPDYTSSNKFT